MSLFFAYVLSVCPALHSVICTLLTLNVLLAAWLLFCSVREPYGSEEYKRAAAGLWWMLKVLAVLAVLWVLIPSQKRLDAMMLNYHATYTACNDMGICLGDK